MKAVYKVSSKILKGMQFSRNSIRPYPGGGPQFVQSVIGQKLTNPNPVLNLTFGQQVKAGNRIILGVDTDGAGDNPSGITDNNGTVYTKHLDRGASSMSIWSGIAPVTGTYTITITNANTGVIRVCAGAIEISGSITGFGQAIISTGNATVKSIALNTSAKPAFILAIGCDNNTSVVDNFTADSPLIMLGSIQTGTNFDIAFGFAYTKDKQGNFTYTMRLPDSLTEMVVASFLS